MNEKKTIDILLVEDEEGHVDLIRRAFESYKTGSFNLTVVKTVREAHAFLAKNTPDLTIIDYRLPDGEGIELLPHDREEPSCPMIIMTGQGDERVVAASLKAGALDYFVKSEKMFKDMPHIAERVLREWENILKRKEAEEALKESKAHFYNIFTNANDAIFIIDPEDDSIYEANPKASLLLGYSHEELLSTPISAIHPKEMDKLQAFTKQVFNKSSGWTDELSCTTKSGEVIPAEISASITILSGKSYLLAIVRDITERKRMEETLQKHATEMKKNEEELRSANANLLNILESMEDGVYIVNQEYNIEFVNSAIKKEFGPPEGKKCYDYFHDRQDDCPWCKSQDVFAGKTVHWEWYSFKNKKTYDLVDTPITNADGHISKLEIFRDITERKHAESELKKSEQKIEAIIKSLGEGIVSIGADSTIRFVNQEFCSIFGYAREKLEGKNLKILMPKKYRQAHTEGLKKYLNGVPPKIIGERIKIEGLHKSGKVFPIELRIEETVEDSGERFFTASIRDITEIEKAEKELNKYASEMEQLAEERSKQLIHADRMITLGTLSAGVAHEINNPVGFISNNLQIFEKLWDRSIRACLEKANSENEDKNLSLALNEMPGMVKAMREGTRRISNIVHSLDRFSRITELVFEPSNICEVIEAAVELSNFDLVVKHKVKVQLDLPNGIPNIKISSQEIEQVLVNLITNSGHAMGKIADRKELTLKIAALHVSNNIVIEITDNGYGMDEKTLNDMFNPFFTTKGVGKGTGLGLSVCRGIIDQHRGTITATSTLGEGTTFTITLPFDPEKKERRKKDGLLSD